VAKFSKDNPKPGPGRPPGLVNAATADIRALARSHTPETIARLVEMRDGKARNKNGEIIDAPAAQQFAAMKELLDRGHGKSVQPHDGDGEGGPINIDIASLSMHQLEQLLIRLDERDRLRAALTLQALPAPDEQ
jgi:hypothetical protein